MMIPLNMCTMCRSVEESGYEVEVEGRADEMTRELKDTKYAQE